VSSSSRMLARRLHTEGGASVDRRRSAGNNRAEARATVAIATAAIRVSDLMGIYGQKS